MKKKVATLVIAGLVMTSLVACTGTDNDVQSQASESESEEDTTEEKESEAVASEDTELDDTYEIVKSYGETESGYSNLTFTFIGGTLDDAGDYYTAEVNLYSGIEIPNDLEVGDNYTICTDKVNETYREIIITGENTCCYSDQEDFELYWYVGDSDDEDGVVSLYMDSDDRVPCYIGSGIVRIAKDATVGIAILCEYSDFDPDSFDEEDNFYNGVKFNENGLITELVFFGD